MTRFYISDCETGLFHEVSRAVFFRWIEIFKAEKNCVKRSFRGLYADGIIYDFGRFEFWMEEALEK